MFSPPETRGLFMAQLTLRVLTITFTLSAIGVLVKSGQSVSVFGIDMQAHYTYSSALRYNLWADAVVCTCCFLSLILACALSRPKPDITNYFYALLLDMVMVLLAISGCSAATAIGYVGRHGQDKMGWPAICDQVYKFCAKATLSLSLSYLAFFCLLILSVMSAYKLKSLAIQ